MLVFDTSAFINGWRFHYPPKTFPSVWELISAAMTDGRIRCPQMVFEELRAKDDEVFAWVQARAGLFVDPTPEVQAEAGRIDELFADTAVRDRADPFVIAEAVVHRFAVVTYEGTNTFTGRPTKRADQKMPGICRQVGVECLIVPGALGRLGASI